MIGANDILSEVDLLRLAATEQLDPSMRAAQGQYLTPLPVARLMASFFGDLPEAIHLLDPGAGVGSLTAAFIDEVLSRQKRPKSIFVTAFETDSSLLPYLERVLRTCADRCYGADVTYSYEIVAEDFIAECEGLKANLFRGARRRYNCIIMNPPYRKIAADSSARRWLRLIDVETGNLYTAFMAVAVQMLDTGGQFLSITPRSFCNGAYFRAFREFFLSRMDVRRIHVFESRKKAFSDDAVLQENVIVHAVKGAQEPYVHLSASEDAEHPVATERQASFGDIVHASDPEQYIRIPSGDLDNEVVRWMHSLTHTPDELGVTISTGRVVDFRAREFLRAQPEEGAVPLIYPSHFKDGRVAWPNAKARKPNAIVSNAQTADLLIPGGTYVLVKRFTSKEEPRRVVAAVCDSSAFCDGPLGIENHLNYLHREGHGLPKPLAVGLVAFLNSSIFDLYFRQFSGHTQVNASDLRKVRFPSPEKLAELGERLGATPPVASMALDNLCSEVIFDMAKHGMLDPVKAARKIREALDVLKLLDMPREQRNERSALALLALLDLKPGDAWSKATRPMLGITQMMDYFKQHYEKKYAPNTRETVRRQTIHQFEQAGLVQSNPDDPTRPINSPHWCYQITEAAYGLLRHYGSPEWSKGLKKYMAGAPSLRARYAHEREMNRVPVVLADGMQLYLTPGKHSQLTRDIVQEFCPRFAGGGTMVYVGDTGDKSAYFDRAALAKLDVSVDAHGKFPDVVVADRRRKWVFLIEAVTSHGPLNPKRHDELKRLFDSCKYGPVFVTAFADRSTLAKYVADISWETEVWVAESPSHLIHFNGDRFLGPYAGKKSK